MAIVGALGVSLVPSMIGYWRAGTTKGGAQELEAGLNTARHLALAKARAVCVEVAGGRYRFRLGGCGSPEIWTGPGTDANGFFRLTNGVTIATNANPVFGYLGAATGATLTVTHPQGGSVLSVVVSPAGRVRICPAGGCQ